MKQLLVLVFCLIGFAPAPTSGQARKEMGARRPPPTLEDAYAVKTIGAIDVSPDQTLAAFEISGGITIHSFAPNGTQVKRLSARDVLRFSPSFDTGQLQAARGYVVFRPNLRSPHGIYRSFPHGEQYYEKARGAAGIPIMVDDFTSGIASLVQSGMIDPERIGMFGHSDGGWATNLIVTETPVVKAAVVISGVSSAILLSALPLPLLTREGRDLAAAAVDRVLAIVLEQ